MNFYEVISNFSDFFDYIEEKLNKSGFMVIGVGDKKNLLKAKKLWEGLNSLEKKGAESSYGSTSRTLNIRIRNINAVMEVCFEGDSKEFFQFRKVHKVRQHLFNDDSKFIDLDKIISESHEKVEQKFDIKINYNEIQKEIGQIISKLTEIGLNKEEIGNVLEDAIKDCLKGN